MDPKVLVALIGVSASLIVSLISALITWYTRVITSKDIERLRSELTTEQSIKIENLRSELAAKKSLNDARVDYEYDARKRLYEVCEPLLFQAQLALADVESRVTGILALHQSPEKEISRKIFQSDYYVNNTIFRIFHVACIYQIMNQTLTFHDLRLKIRK